MRTYKGRLVTLPENGVFVFGSNTEGRHGKGAALDARTYFGAEQGNANGPQGRSYAIITKDLTKTKHPSVDAVTIALQALGLYLYASQNPYKKFYVAYSGTGTNLNGYTNEEMALMFCGPHYVEIPDNIIFEEEFWKLIVNKKEQHRQEILNKKQ